MFLDVGGSVKAGLLSLTVVVETRHQLAEIVVAAHLEASFAGLQPLSLLELLVVRAEDDGHAPYGGLQHVVDAYAEAAAHVAHVGVAVDAAEQSEAVDNED